MGGDLSMHYDNDPLMKLLLKATRGFSPQKT